VVANLKTILLSAIKPYSAILFLNDKVAGFLLLAITFSNPSVAISGILAVVFTILFAEFIEFNEEFLSKGFYVYNSLLVGMGIGFIFSPSFTSVALIAISSIFTFMLSFMLNRLFSAYKIPILSLPFSIVTMFIYLASLKYSGLLSTLVNNAVVFDIVAPTFLSGFLKSLGTIFFLPTNIAGILLSILLFYYSRVTLIMALVGFYFGAFVHSLLIGSYVQALQDPYSFNYMLVSIALCGVFLLPTVKNFFLALIGISISVVITDAISILFNYYSIPVFTLPFNITVISFIFILSMTYYKEFNIDIRSTPEQSLRNYLSKIFRFGTIYTKISLPFSGVWAVYQAFDGKWTHKGRYKYAYDFVKKIDSKTYKGDGLYLSDYYAFGESILSPVSGYVVDMRQDLVDNIIGDVDRINNWGNYIIIKSDGGFFVEISHLMQYSLSVTVGDYIQSNSIIAKCGNSGYSPEPHIHIQVQEIGFVGAFTKEFIFSEYIKDDKLFFNAYPKQDENILSVITNRSISSRFTFILDDKFTYEVFKDDKKIDEYDVKVKMNSLGEFYFQDRYQNKLYFYNDLRQFYFYNYDGGDSYLKWMFILAPRLPFIDKKSISFDDYLPIYLLYDKIQIICIELLSIIKKDLYKRKYKYKFDGNCLSSELGQVELDIGRKMFASLEYKNIKLRKII